MSYTFRLFLIILYHIRVIANKKGYKGSVFMDIKYKNFNMDALIDPFLSAQDIGSNSRTTYSNALIQFARWCKERNITHPKHEEILAYKLWLDTKQLSSYTKAVYIVVIRRFFLWADEEEKYGNVARKIKGIKRYSKS